MALNRMNIKVKNGKTFACFNFCIDKFIVAKIGTGESLIKFVIRLIVIIVIHLDYRAGQHR